MKHVVRAHILCTIACFLFVTSGMLSAQQQKFTYSQAKMAHPDWVQVPGALIRPDCVHEVPNGASVGIGSDGQVSGDVMLDGVLIAHYDACPEAPIVTRPLAGSAGPESDPGFGNGFVEASYWPVDSSLDEMAGNWTVPSNPSVNGALIYLFNGMERSDQGWMLLPVLQYGFGGAGGGYYWAIASWLVGSSAYHSPLETVNPGNALRGYTKTTSVSGNTIHWKVSVKDNTTGAYSYLLAHSTGYWTFAFAGVLEVYGVTSCSDYPSNGEVVFTHSDAYHGYPAFNLLTPPEWRPVYGSSYGGPDCGFGVIPGTKSILLF
jgi:hypothetical protein